jgi:transposase
MLTAVDLPNDVDALKHLVLENSTTLQRAQAQVLSQQLELEKLRFEIACLKRAKFGRSSEQLDAKILQMQLTLEGSAGEPCAAA